MGRKPGAGAGRLSHVVMLVKERRMKRIGVLVMAYGSPETLDDVEPYFTHIRGGRRPSPAQVEALRERYRRIGGRSPLLAITQAQAAGLARALATARPETAFQVEVGMKHWHPFIAQAVGQLLAAGITGLVGIVMAPHYSRLSIETYHQAVRQALAAAGRADLPVALVERWGTHPLFIRLVARRVAEALQGWDARRTAVVFTAHSLPARIRADFDPYERELLISAALVATALGLPDWRLAYQSASHTGEPWLGPDILEVLDLLAASGTVRQVVVCPVGFVADHLEVLYDIDIEAQARATDLGLALRRTRSLNDDPLLIAALTDLALQAADRLPATGRTATAAS